MAMRVFTHWRRLSFRLPILIALFAGLTGVVAGMISYYVAHTALVDTAKERMELVRNERIRAVTTFIDDTRIGLASFTTRPTLARDIAELSAAFEKMNFDARDHVIAAYTEGNPYPADTRSALYDANDGSDYSLKHKTVHEQFLRMLQIKELDDLMVVDVDGHVVYSVMKQADFGTDLLIGPYKDSNAAVVFRKALSAKPPWEPAFADMGDYPPAGHPAIFMGQAVAGRDGAIAGVLLFQLNNRKFRDVANHIQDLGETGEVYLVGPDATRRSQSRFSTGALLAEKVNTQSALRSSGGFTESDVALDYRGKEVVSAYAPVNLMGVRWGIVSKIDLDEALTPLRPLVIASSSGVVLATLLIALMGFGAARRFSKPLDQSLRVMEKLSRGDLHVEIGDGGEAVETREIAAALKMFHVKLVQTDALMAEVNKAKEQVEKALTDAQTERARTEAILAGAPDPILLVRSDSIIDYANEQVSRVLGYDPGELVGQRIDNLIPQRFRMGHTAQVRGFFDVGEVRQMGAGRELYALAKDGREIPVEIALSPIKTAGKPIVVALMRDITEQRAAERAVREARDAAEAATKAKSDFLASMSHEIRTPMNGITGMADLLGQTGLDDEQKHMVRTIRESGNALITVINDILDFSKIEAGKLDLENVTMSVADAVEGVASTLTPAAAKKGVRIHVFAGPALPAAVHGDPTRLRQILFNLGGNAIKFSNGRDVQIRAMLAAPRNDGKTWLRFVVLDQGIGISAANQAKLFKAFSQAESSTTRRYGGTGLGLAICKRLTDMMGGAIGVDSREGLGSTFWVELPFDVAEGVASAQKERDLKGLTVLLVGSEGARFEAIDAYVRHWGAEIVTAADAGAAADALKTRKCDSIILDLGLDAGRQDLALGALRAVGNIPPVIALQDFQNRGARIIAPDVVTVDANPLIRYRVVSAVAVAAGRASPEIKTEDDMAFVAVKALTVEEARAAGQLILLAEDNLTNQDVIRRQLKLLGHACEVAANGAEALEAYKKGNYALLLTDCHMPEMDGYELTGAIRAAEQGTGKRLPIVAVTANALQGEAERCLAAGMDDYVSKPIAMPALVAALRKWMPVAATIAPKPAAGKAASGAVIDERALKDVFGEDDATFKDILQSFVGPSQDIIAEIMAAQAGRSAAGVKDAAHKLKSSARSIGANTLADLCVTLEGAGKTGDWAQIDALAPRARDAFVEVERFIAKL